MSPESECDLFWDFSVRVYKRPGVAPACLALQDRLGLDVNLVLYCLYWAACGRPALDPGTLRLVIDRALPWQDEVVRPIRAARRRAKIETSTLSSSETASFYGHVLEVELKAEKAEQLIIARTAVEALRDTTAKPDQPEAEVMRLNLNRYMAMIQVVPGAAENALVDQIIQVAEQEAAK